jgi:hypothetical protein
MNTARKFAENLSSKIPKGKIDRHIELKTTSPYVPAQY